MYRSEPFRRIVSTMVLIALILPAIPWASIQGGEVDRSYEDRGMTRDGVLPEPYPLGIDLPPLPPHYIIICPDRFKEEVRPLAVHRTISGLPSRVYSLSTIIDNYTGVDDQQKVHRFLRDLHGEYPTFKWLLIMADSEYLMPRKLWHYARTYGQPFGDNYSSDVYYAGLDSDWNDDGDERFGELITYGNIEADLDWDIYVGRVPASTEQDARNYTNKLLRYEKNPPVGSWMKRFLNWGSLMEPPNRDFEPNRYFDHKSNAYKVCQRVEANLSDHLEVLPLYDYPQLEGGNYTPYDGRDTLNRANMLSAFNNGASMLNFVGQARYEAYALNDYGPPTGFGENFNWNEPLRYSDDELFTNQDMMPFMYASTCDSAKFFDTSQEYNDKSLETWLTSPSGGMIGMISSTGTSARGEEQIRSWGNWYLDEQFWRLFLGEGVTRPGQGLYSLKERYRERWLTSTNDVKETVLGMIYTYILLGDPYVDIYTDIAGRFSHKEDLDIHLYDGNRMTRFKVTDRDGRPVPYPDITIYDSERYITVRGDPSGWVNTTLDLGDAEEVNITLCAHNMVPSYLTVDVLPAIADVLLQDLLIEPAAPVPGDLAMISARILNKGGMDASGVQATVEYVGGNGDPTYYYQHFDIGTLSSGSSYSISWNWTVRHGSHLFRVELVTSSPDLDPYNQKLDVAFDNQGPLLQFFPGTGLIKPSALLPPGTRAFIDADIYNNGAAGSMVDLRLYLGAPEEGGLPISEPVEIGPVDRMEWVNVSIGFTTPSSTGMIYIVMDPDGDLPSDMTDEPYKSLIEINQPPILTGNLSFTLMEDAGTASFRIDDRFTDPDNSSEMLRMDLDWYGPLDMWLSRTNNATYLNVDPLADVNGEFEANLSVSDGVITIQERITLTVVEVNDPPIFTDAVGGSIEVTTLEDSQLTLEIRVNDVDDANFTIGSDGAPFTIGSGDGRIDWTPVQEDVGTREFTIFAADGRGGNSSIILIVHVVQVNDPPTISPIGDMSVNFTYDGEIVINIQDEEGGPYVITSSSDILQHVDGNRMAFNITERHVGNNNVRITVIDGIHTAHIDFNITVIAATGEDEGDGEWIFSGGLIAAAAVAAGMFLVLLAGLFMFRRTRTDELVRDEMIEADSAYYDDLYPEE